jgi:hypothetical protein
MATATLDWSACPLVEVIPGKVGGAPLLKSTRLPVDAITGNYDAFRDEGLSPDAAIRRIPPELDGEMGEPCNTTSAAPAISANPVAATTRALLAAGSKR